MLRILAKINSFLSRLTLVGKLVFGALFVLLFTVVVLLPTAHALNTRIFPLFKAEQQYYVDLRPTTGLSDHRDVLASSLAGLSGLPRENLSALLSALFASEPSRLGAYKEGDQIVFYARNPLRPVIMDESLLQLGWTSEEHSLGRDQYVLLSANQASALPEDVKLNGLWAKLGLYRRAAQDRGIVYVHPEKSQPSIYGVFSENESGWQVSFSGSSWSVGDRVETVLLPSTSSIFVRNSQSLQGIQGFPWPASVKTVLEGPLQELWSAPGSFTAFAGDINMFAENPFQDDLRWENARTVESSAATAILTSLLESLMVRYPMAFERVLPDNSKVFELKKGADQFLLPETSVDVIIHPQGVMTYPHDQLRYEFGDGTLLIRKGDDASNQNETMELSCGLADPKLEILVSGDFIDTSLWTMTFFALNKRNGVVCIFW